MSHRADLLSQLPASSTPVNQHYRHSHHGISAGCFYCNPSLSLDCSFHSVSIIWVELLGVNAHTKTLKHCINPTAKRDLCKNAFQFQLQLLWRTRILRTNTDSIESNRILYHHGKIRDGSIGNNINRQTRRGSTHIISLSFTPSTQSSQNNILNLLQQLASWIFSDPFWWWICRQWK